MYQPLLVFFSKAKCQPEILILCTFSTKAFVSRFSGLHFNPQNVPQLKAKKTLEYNLIENDYPMINYRIILMFIWDIDKLVYIQQYGRCENKSPANIPS